MTWLELHKLIGELTYHEANMNAYVLIDGQPVPLTDENLFVQKDWPKTFQDNSQ